MEYTSFTTPGTYEQMQADQAQQERRRKIIEAVRAQNLSKDDPNRMVSGRVVPYGVGEGLTKLASALISRSQLKDVDEKERKLKADQDMYRTKATEDVINTIIGKDAVDEKIGDYREDIGGYDYVPRETAVEGDPIKGALQAAADPALRDSGVDKIALAMMQKQGKSKPSYKVVPERIAGDMWQNREVINGQKAGFTGEPYQKGASATNVSATATLGGDKYADERMKKQAQMMDELGASAKSAYNESLALDRFIKASPEGTAGGAQPIITGVKNLLSSFGYSDEALISVATMKQAIGDMKVNKIAQFTAKGLTDKDMEIINETLPRVETSVEARIAIAEIMKKVKDKEVKDYIYALDQEKQKHPGVSGGVITPRWLEEYRNKQDNTFTPSDYKEIKVTPDGRKIGLKADGTYEEIK